jgi:hypothetical protein
MLRLLFLILIRILQWIWFLVLWILNRLFNFFWVHLDPPLFAVGVNLPLILPLHLQPPIE